MFNFSENIQRGILYLLKSDSNFHLQIAHLIKPEHFEFTSHKNMFKVIRQYYEDYHKLPIDEFILENVKELLTSKENLSDYSDELIIINKLDPSSYENTEYIMDLVEKFAKKQELTEALKQSIVLMKEGSNIEAIEGIVRKALLISRTVDNGQMYFDSVKSRWDRSLSEKDRNKFKTILPTCNNNLEGGHNTKELCMVVAPPGVGKSLFLVNQAVQSLTEGRRVLYISLEMSEDKIAQRFDSILTRLPNQQLKEPSYQLKLYERLKKFQGAFPGARLVIKEFPTGQATVNTIRSLLVQLRNYEEFEPELIIVDYLELLRPVRQIDAEYQAQQRIAEELRGLGVESNCLVWTATQTNRQGKKVALITDVELGDSYGKIRTADWAISLNQDEEEYNSGTMRGYIMKARDSKQRYVIPMKVNYNTLHMEEGSFTEELSVDI